MYEKHYPGHKSVFKLNDIAIGEDFVIAAGPCAVESEQQLKAVINQIYPYVHVVRGGLFKARTSPHAFSGVGSSGIDWLTEVSQKYDKPVVVEALDREQLALLAPKIDIIQIGARNMYNYPLLAAAAATERIILLKRHFAATVDELLLAAEHILTQGNPNVILCERGIRTFETRTRNCLDLGAVAALKQLTHLPIFVDPSHAAGDASLVPPLCRAAVAAGADGLLLEVHQAPAKALSDGPQSLTPSQLKQICVDVNAILSGVFCRDSRINVEF
ncbi:MAG: 3-deoxy-7-phosphoheptulonate synthase [Firmicutes bacterium]|nr:3-deoxy-7-phosphoheptulonate synthase [Bacillota bacterium]